MNQAATYMTILLMLLSVRIHGQDTIKSMKVPEVPSRDVHHKLWKEAPSVAVQVNPQNMIAPALNAATVKELKVKSIHDGKNIAFLIEWIDSTRDAMVDVAKFSDQLAVQFPMDTASYPSFMMGNEGGKVHIIHWKAIWQDDIEKGYRDVKDAHPNYWTDLYYFPDNKDSVYARNTTVHDYQSKEGKNYMHGAYAGNPMSDFNRKNPSEEATAIGFGTLTTQKLQNATAWGVWENNTWKVLILRPLKSEDKEDALLGSANMVAFAVWDGNAKNVGAKKHYSTWTIFQIIAK